jgi:hypothetical protein
MNIMAVRNGGEQEVNKYYYGGQSLSHLHTTIFDR